MSRKPEATGKGSVEPPLPEPGEPFEGRRVRHGTPSGFRQHQADGTDPCEPCRLAKANYDWRWRQGDATARKNRLRAQAQGLASTRLRKAHQAEYDRYYEEESERLFRDAGFDPPTPRRKRRRT